MCSRLRAPVAWCGMLGTDSVGAEYLNQFQLEGVVTSHIMRSRCDNPTGIACINVGNDGSNTIVIIPGANSELSKSDIADKTELIESSSVLLCQVSHVFICREQYCN